MARSRHPHKAIEAAIRHAENQGWRVTVGGSHAWGFLWCPHRARDGCPIRVLSTPRNPEAHARQLIRDIDHCPHVRSAHWHGFWRGPRAGPRQFELRWLPPIAVALADDTPEARMRHAKLKPIRDLDAEIDQVRNELETRDAPPGDG